MTERPNEISAYAGLGADVNKPDGNGNQATDTKQGTVGGKLPELSLEMTTEAISALTQKWEKAWTDSPVRTDWEKKAKDNENYWLGIHFTTPVKLDKSRPNVDNLIFESLETYLPQVTRRNPEPLVTLANGEDQTNPGNQKFVTELKGKLGDLADSNKIRLKLKRAARHWGINLIGVLKHGWDLDCDCPTSRVVRPMKMIFDPECTIDEDGYHGRYLGERRKLEASKMLAIIGNDSEDKDAANAVKVINDLVKDDKATEVSFIEWWTPEYMCWTLKKEVLLKKKNPNWNYDQEPAPIDPNTPPDVTAPTTNVDNYGNATAAQPEPVKGINHFPSPRVPYSFLTMFSLDDQPMDKTSLIGQNLANQDRINKRNKQIDRNADNMNDGMIVSLARAGLTESQAKNVTAALRKGGVVAIPDGDPQQAIYRPVSPGLPADVFNDLADTRNRTRDIFGVRGSSAAGVGSEKTVRGKYVVRDLDTDRIGGGISEYVEQLADATYNWWVQLLFVYGNLNVTEQSPKVVISVKEGSLLPKDSTTLASQAIDLANNGKMSTLDLYKKLEYSNPEEMASNVWLEANAPEILYANDPRVAQAIKMKQEAAQQAASANATPAKTPSESISFKDMPPEGKIQMAKQAGIELAPEHIVLDEASKIEAKVRSAIPKPASGP